MRTFLRNNGLSFVFLLLFAGSLVGQTVSGYRVHNEDRVLHGETEISGGEYLHSGHFVEAVSENWESEFLQMAMFVVLTAYLFQKGSPESRDPDSLTPDVVLVNAENAPWPIRQGGVIADLYGYSLSIALGLLFAASFAVHVVSGARSASAEAISHGEPGISAIDYLWTAQLWFESLQNWQSEFLSVGMLVVLSIYLRHRGSPESKPLEFLAPHKLPEPNMG